MVQSRRTWRIHCGDSVFDVEVLTNEKYIGNKATRRLWRA
jgi:hypothetical protein